MKSLSKMYKAAGAFSTLAAMLMVSSCSESIARMDSIASSFGNAMAANTALQMVDPWPKYVEKTKIQTDGTKAANAVENYRSQKEVESIESGLTAKIKTTSN